jgi:hypothetical protein
MVQINSLTMSQDIQKKLDAVLFKEFSGAKIAPWNVNDQMGTVYGWPEQINAKLVQLNDKGTKFQ